jgi:hypothetical protein
VVWTILYWWWSFLSFHIQKKSRLRYKFAPEHFFTKIRPKQVRRYYEWEAVVRLMLKACDLLVIRAFSGLACLFSARHPRNHLCGLTITYLHTCWTFNHRLSCRSTFQLRSGPTVRTCAGCLLNCRRPPGGGRQPNTER